MPKKATAADAELILKLYELRREPEMRKARNWWMNEFWPQSADDFIKLAMSFPSQKTSGCGKPPPIGKWPQPWS
jgi:hypothetical protein